MDLVLTSETNVTVSLDPLANALDPATLDAPVEDLSKLCRVALVGPCASLSLLGRNIRAILHQLGEAFELFEEQKIYLVSQAANDLNFTFVIDSVVGPIYETGDVLGHDRLLPECREGDVMLIANVGAYGRAMSSSYNLRDPAAELVL